MIKLETFHPEEQRGCLLNQTLRLLVDATSLADGSPQALLRINALRKCLAVSPGNCEICLFYTNPADGNSNPLVSALENIGAETTAKYCAGKLES